MSVLQMSISAGLLVIATALIRSVALDKLPKKMFLALWGVALFRLLLPVSMPLTLKVKVPDILSEAPISPPVFAHTIKMGEITAIK